MDQLGAAAQMGTKLLEEVERRLLYDLSHYGIQDQNLKIDWSESLGEGHCTRCLEGTVEELSGLNVLDGNGKFIAEGWFDFVHGGDGLPFVVFWLFLSTRINNEWVRVKNEPIIPDHIWEQLTSQSKDACCNNESYDQRWSRDPKVVAWRLRHLMK